MKAIAIYETGDVSVLKFVDDFPKPTRKPGEVLVKVVSTSVNPVDTYVRKGVYPPKHFPKILGGDLSGVVAEADEVSLWKEGDAVFGLSSYFMGDYAEGTYAEYVAVPADWLARVPAALPLDEAGGLPLVALTAWQSLEACAVKAGERILVYAAAGGVGHVAVQLAKARGLWVAGVAGPANQDFLRELGCDAVVDYKSEDVVERFGEHSFDVVLDTLGGDVTEVAYFRLLKQSPKARLQHVMNRGTQQGVLEKVQAAANSGQGPQFRTTFVRPNGIQMGELAKLVEEGKLRLSVAEKMPLAEAARAQELVETWHVRGKVVLVV